MAVGSVVMHWKVAVLSTLQMGVYPPTAPPMDKALDIRVKPQHVSDQGKLPWVLELEYISWNLALRINFHVVPEGFKLIS